VITIAGGIILGVILLGVLRIALAAILELFEEYPGWTLLAVIGAIVVGAMLVLG
jgi:hypothetical protein